METPISVNDFVFLLWDCFFTKGDRANCFNNSSPIVYGRYKGWLEDEDERFSQNFLNRRTAARIVHCFMKIELNIPDEVNILEAEKLQDLYTCRVCVNHIAQVYCKKIMFGQEVEKNGNIVQIFNHLDLLTENQCKQIIERIKFIVR